MTRRQFAWATGILVLGLLFAPKGRASLVVILPVNEGVLLAADSRSTFRDTFQDGYLKIKFVEGRTDLAFATTGISRLVRPTVLPLGPGETIETTRIDFDAAEVIGHYLRTRSTPALSIEYFRQLGQFVAKQVDQELTPGDRSRWTRQGFCTVQLVQYFPRTQATALKWCNLVIDAQGKPLATDFRSRNYLPTDKAEIQYFGVTRYVREHVLEGEGQSHLPAEFLAVWRKRLQVQAVSASQGSLAVAGLIRATIKTSETVPIPDGAGVGGEIHVYLVDGVNAPKEITVE